MTDSNTTSSGAPIAAVRYQTKDIDRAIRFYTENLDFKLEHKAGAAFAMVSRGPLQLVLSGPGSSGARPMPDGRPQEPGGWNRIILYVPDLDAQIQSLKTAGAHFRNAVEVGPGGKQIQVEDPDGNPIEFHEGGAGATK
jgi:glyoxylase I family protein